MRITEETGSRGRFARAVLSSASSSVILETVSLDTEAP
jgi:hypothetical protein